MTTRRRLETCSWRRAAPLIAVIACTVMLTAGSAHAQSGPEFDIYIQCTVAGDNLNTNDLSASSVGGLYADPTHTNWGGVRSYLEGAQRDMQQDGSLPGPRQHAGVTVVKWLSTSSPRYMQALVQGTTLSSCMIEFWRMNFSTSSREKYFTVQLTNAKVAYIANQGSDDYILEEITLHAQSITRSHVLGATSFTDTLTPGP